MTDTDPQNRNTGQEASDDLANQLDDLLREVAAQSPDGADAEAQSIISATDDPYDEPDELDQQLEDLIARATEEITPPAPEVEAEEAAPAQVVAEQEAGEAPSSVDDMPADASEESDNTETEPEGMTAEVLGPQGEDLLADQIQEMLDEAKSAQDDASAGGEVSIEQIDDLLAEQADDAVSDGGFESFDEVMGTSPTDEAAADPDVVPETPDEEALAAAHFAAPEEVLEESHDEVLAGDFATATDVAEELDTQPELAAEPIPPEPEPEPELVTEADPDHETKAWRLPDCYALAEVGAEYLRRVCALINRPMGRFSPQTRHTIGYIALGTLAQASFLMLYALLS